VSPHHFYCTVQLAMLKALTAQVFVHSWIKSSQLDLYTYDSNRILGSSRNQRLVVPVELKNLRPDSTLCCTNLTDPACSDSFSIAFADAGDAVKFCLQVYNSFNTSGLRRDRTTMTHGRLRYG
jgi:hypothetical protein